MVVRILCPGLPDLLRKTILSFCEINIHAQSKIEVIGSIHIRGDGEELMSFLLSEVRDLEPVNKSVHAQADNRKSHHNEHSRSRRESQDGKHSPEGAHGTKDPQEPVQQYHQSQSSDYPNRQRKQSHPDMHKNLCSTGGEKSAKPAGVLSEGRSQNTKKRTWSSEDSQRVKQAVFPQREPADQSVSQQNKRARDTPEVQQWTNDSPETSQSSLSSQTIVVKQEAPESDQNLTINIETVQGSMSEPVEPGEIIKPTNTRASPDLILVEEPGTSHAPATTSDAAMATGHLAAMQPTHVFSSSPLACRRCSSPSFEAVNLKQLVEHYILQHEVSSIDELMEINRNAGVPMLTCGLCGAGLDSSRSLADHFNSIHKVQVSQSGVTNMTSMNQQAMNMISSPAMTCNISGVSDWGTSAMHSCPYCNKKFRSKDGIRCHINTKHHVSRQYACFKCSMVFLTRQKLYSHRQKFHRATMLK